MAIMAVHETTGPRPTGRGHRHTVEARAGVQSRTAKHWIAVAGTAAVFAALIACGVCAAPVSRADEVAYVVNVTVRPGYNLPNARAALDYGYGLCDRMRAGEGFPQLMASIKSDFNTDDEYQADYLLIQASQELCPAMIWHLRRTAAGCRLPPPTI